MRRILVPLVALAFGLGILPLMAPPEPSPPAGTPATTSESGFVGSWQFVSRSPGQPAAPALITFVAGGTVIASGLPVQAAGPAAVVIGTGQGVWVPTGTETAAATVVILVVDASGNYRGTETDRLDLALGSDRRSFQGQFTATVADPAGRAENTLTGTMQGVRIAISTPNG